MLDATLNAELSAVRTDIDATILRLADDVQRALAALEMSETTD